MSVEDKLAIYEAIAQYSYTYDGRDADAFAQVFLEDGVFEIVLAGATTPAVKLSSRAEIRAWAAKRLQARAGRFTSRHYQSGTVFDALTADSAVTRTMVLVTHQSAGEREPRPTLSGVYHDTWHKRADGWRLARRVAHLDRDPDAAK